ncbi:hypothetical protein [Agromyces arachidis]|uniref:hypothetical protein n=1 Tax=Agromyces arachidis TaxID=766966 RepID=UPI0040563BBC
MNTNRTAFIAGTAAILLALTGCAGVDGQFDDGARAESAQNRLSAAQQQLSPDQALKAQAYELLRQAKEAEFQARAAQQAAADMSRNEVLRSVKQSESTPVLSVQERIRQSKQSESEPAPVTAEPMTPEQVREFKASQVQ